MCSGLCDNDNDFDEPLTIYDHKHIPDIVGTLNTDIKVKSFKMNFGFQHLLFENEIISELFGPSTGSSKRPADTTIKDNVRLENLLTRMGIRAICSWVLIMSKNSKISASGHNRLRVLKTKIFITKYNV
jgi:hypothetical protein